MGTPVVFCQHTFLALKVLRPESFYEFKKTNNQTALPAKQSVHLSIVFKFNDSVTFTITTFVQQ